jgi:Polyketide cyclase / dehydrase and lipid transport
VCIAMTLPLLLPLGALGGWLGYRINSSRAMTGSLAMLLLAPSASLTWDARAIPPVFEVRSAIEIAATPEQVWKHVVSFSELPEPREWLFRAGLAYPQRAHIVGSGAGAVRYCEFSTGPFVEPIEVWNEPRLLRFRVTANPAPMHEWSPYARVLPKYLHGYLISKQGQFRLTRLDDRHTLLEGTTWYQHGLWPAEYWRWWSDAIIHRIHLRVLTHIRTLAEQDGA